MSDCPIRCVKCGRRVRPKWWTLGFVGLVAAGYVGPTCRKKLIASGMSDDQFERRDAKKDGKQF